jgi:hypothetical protein
MWWQPCVAAMGGAAWRIRRVYWCVETACARACAPGEMTATLMGGAEEERAWRDINKGREGRGGDMRGKAQQ